MNNPKTQNPAAAGPKTIPPKLREELFSKRIKLFNISWVLSLLFLAIIVYSVYQLYLLSNIKPEKPDVEIIKIDLDYIDKLNELESFGDIPSPNDPGFGKDNPFGGI